MNLLREYYENRGVLIASHRGANGGNVVQNTITAYRNALFHKADMFEVDVIRSKDGQFFAFHDGQEQRVFNKECDIRELTAKEIMRTNCYNSLNHVVNQKIETIEEVLKAFEGKGLINIDRSWFYWDTFLEALKGYRSLPQIVLKSPVRKVLLDQLQASQLDVMYMPIVHNKTELDEVLQYKDINLVAIELIFRDLNSELITSDVLSMIHEKGLLAWVNALTLDDDTTLSAGLDDNSAITDNGKSWGKLVELGFDIIQTDWPAPLYDYLRKQNYKKM